MKIKKVDHIGVAVKNISEAARFYTDILGIKMTGTEIVADQKAKVSFLPVDDTNIELLESIEPDGPVAKFIESKGEGIHHIALHVENIEEALEFMKSKGVRLIDQKPRIGARGIRIAFVHPKETRGVLLELCQEE
ncbi:MAG: methylmalonyl-CoA epimerase [Deltaproteobacteria bacterium HGW-Deltaproteobacteria-21]|jgi:methylmalonyl-CoA/ethylmalonyl-CoA epimerase|nr:MAG: methylmalonyl-CoA epimerase [Deltaproteobacteria bacterium HGW-Deltaproteobacteria-21]